MSMKTLFVTDLDGTLLSTDSQVSRRSAEIISALSREGALITVATARTPATVEPLLSKTFTTVPAIVMTGAALWNRQERSLEETVMFPPSVAREAVELMVSCGVNPFVYTLRPDGRLNVIHCGSLTRREDKFYQERRELKLKKFIFNPPGGYADSIDKSILLLGIAETPVINLLAARMSAYETLSVSAYNDIFNPRISYIEVFSAGVSKAAAVLRVKELTGADRTVVYGDNLNDLPMFEVADESVAPANARPEVRARATRVIGPNSADSVALDILSILDGRP